MWDVDTNANSMARKYTSTTLLLPCEQSRLLLLSKKTGAHVTSAFGSPRQKLG